MKPLLSSAKQTQRPVTMVMSTPARALRKEVRLRVKEAGPMTLSRAMLTVSVYRMETPVLRATILPNLAKGAMMQKKSGMVAMTVVTALETMATPTCRTASIVRHWRLELGS